MITEHPHECFNTGLGCFWPTGQVISTPFCATAPLSRHSYSPERHLSHREIRLDLYTDLENSSLASVHLVQVDIHLNPCQVSRKAPSLHVAHAFPY